MQSNKENKRVIPVFTHLKEIYSSDKNTREEVIESTYQAVRYKFKKLFNNNEPQFFCRVPHVVSLYGDQVTEMFEDKIITTIEKVLISRYKH